MKASSFALGLGVVLLPCAQLAFASSSDDSVVVRRSDNGRLWQTVLKADDPILWHWDTSAVKATLRVTDVVTGITSEYLVSRAGREVWGAKAIPVPVDLATGTEHLYDLTVVQTSDSEDETSVLSARIALLPPAADGCMPLHVNTSGRDWRRVKDAPRLYAYDKNWDESSTLATAWFSAASGTGEIRKNLPGTGGYDFISPRLASALSGNAVATVAVRLGFADVSEPFAIGDLLLGKGGLMIRMR